MKKLTTYAVALFFASVVCVLATPTKDEMMAKETAAWQAFKDKKADDFKKVVDKDMVAIYADGVADVNKEVADMQKWDMKSFAISDYKIFSDEKDVIVSSYVVTLQGTFDGEDASGKYNAGTVWKLEDGAWLAIFHTNIAADSEGNMDKAAQKKE